MELTGVIEMSREEAEAAADEWAGVLGKGSTTDEERAIEAGYRALARGRSLIRLSDTIRAGGADERGRPRLAVAPVRSEWCYLYQRSGRVTFCPGNGSWRSGIPPRGSVGVRFPVETHPWHGGQFRAMVPPVPPSARRHGHRSWHVLFEVPEWAQAPQPPGDPALIQHLGGELWIVHATWDLTPLEQAVLAERTIRAR